MPVTIKRGGLKFRDVSSGEYVDVDVVGERKTSEQIADIEAAGAAERSAIQTKGDQILASIPADYTELSESVEDLESAVDRKANIDGYYETLTAGNAEQLISKNMVTDAVPYAFRTAGGGQSVGDRAYLDKVVGGTVAWNQLAPAFSSENGWRSQKGNIEFGTNSVTFTSTEKSTAQAINRSDSNGGLPLIKGHKYYISFYALLSQSSQIWVQSMDAQWVVSTVDVSASTKTNITNIFESTRETGGNAYFGIYLGYGSNGLDIGETATISNLIVIDLTQMFGSTIADYIYSLEQATPGAGVAWFRKLFPKDYYEYNPGELISVSGASARETVGFNQWDEEWEVGLINSSGVPISGTNTIRSKNFCRILPNTEYFITCGRTDGGNQNIYYLGIFFYDENEQFISRVFSHRVPFVTPNNAVYFKITTNSSAVVYGTTYNHDICINISDLSRNGEYEPYAKHTYPLDSALTLRGIPKLDSVNKLYWDGDEYKPDGTVERRYGVVDLGTLDWTYDSSYNRFVNNDFIIKATPTDFVVGNLICTKYATDAVTYTATSGHDKIIGVTNGGKIRIRDTYYNDAATFKAAMSGVYLVYELATPTTETAEPYQHLQVDGSTEEFVTTGLVPVGHVTRYPDDLRAKLDGLPSNFSTLIAPVEKTYTATQAYASGALFIVNNTLYKATASIANGATITPGTNCTATTLAAIIAALA